MDADKEAERLLPCKPNCDSRQPLACNQHAISCLYLYRPAVAIKLRERDEEITFYKKLWEEAEEVYALSVKRENELLDKIKLLKADRDMWIADDQKQNTALGRVIKERDDLRAEIEQLKAESIVTRTYKGQADSWHAVTRALNEASPGFMSEPYSGMQCAVKTIERMHEEIGRLRNKIAQVIQLGLDFGFSAEPEFSVGQVITHAKYLQQERARLMFEAASQPRTEAEHIKNKIAQLKQENDRLLERLSDSIKSKKELY